jgi:pimeloyl-ACP methyl ester carboxylesterase
MGTFLLVHGAWEAGWVWREVASRLSEAGHEVYRPTLTGLGERRHLSNPAVNLETHITDILGVIRWERLKNVTLVGHSYGGMVATGVADQAQEQVGSLIYLDSFMPKDGQSLFDIAPAERSAGMLRDQFRNGWPENHRS